MRNSKNKGHLETKETEDINYKIIWDTGETYTMKEGKERSKNLTSAGLVCHAECCEVGALEAKGAVLSALA